MLSGLVDSCYIVICWFMLKYTCICWIHTDAMNNRRRKTSLLNTCLSLYCKGSKRVTQGLCVRGSWRPNRNCNILTPNLWPSTLCLSRSQDAQPEVQRPTLLGDGFLYCILSATSLVAKLHRGSRGPPRPGVVSLPHLV